MKYAIWVICVILAIIYGRLLYRSIRFLRFLNDLLRLGTLMKNDHMRDYALSRLPDSRVNIIFYICVLIALAVIAII